MCPTTGSCRLCLCSRTEIKELVDEDGQHNDIYEIAAKYFDPMLLTTAICANCWQHIYDFYEFQQSVLKVQTDLGNVENNESIVKLEIMLIDEEDDNKENPKEDQNLSIPYTIELKHPSSIDSEDEIPLLLIAEDEDNKEDYKEVPNVSVSNSIEFKDSNPFESEDEIPLGEYSIKKIQELENLRLKETKKHIKNVKKLNKLPSLNDAKKDTEISEEFNFTCIFCDKKFKSAGNLRSHTTIHTHVKGTYQCPYCETIFLYSKNIYRHVKLFHPNEIVNFNAKDLNSLQKDVNWNANVAKKNVASKEDAKVYSLNKEVSNIAKKNQVSVTSETTKTLPQDQLKVVCTLCNNKKFKHPYLLRYHMTYKHNRESNRIQCPHCPSKTSCRKNLRRHIKLVHPEKYVEPEITNEPKVDLNLIGQDLNSTEKHTPNYDDYDAFIAKWKPDLECPLCKSTFTNLGLLGKHFREEHPDKESHITCCEQKILGRKRLVEHLRFHLDPNSFKCQLCGRCVNNSIALRRHMRVHSGIKPFQCEVCPKSFRTRIKLLTHSGTHSTERNVICKVCNRGFATKLILDKHVYNTHNKHRYLCDQCGKHCDNDNALKEHLLEHAGVDNPKWRCDKCGTQFTSRSTLRSHINIIHIDAKAIYVCTECSQHFYSKHNFNVHNKSVHGGECKPKFKCIECDKELARAAAFRDHAAIHTGESHYQCPHCPIILKHKKNIGRHIKTLHPLEFSQMNQPKRSKVKKK